MIVHKNFSTHMNDIALLKLGKETHYLLKDIRDERLSFKELESTSLQKNAWIFQNIHLRVFLKRTKT